jgi:hypothetical protein
MTPDPTDLQAAIRSVYRGPLEGFVGRRDSVVKQLRASKQREAADRVKALRKPSRVAWALGQVVFEEPAIFARLESVILSARDAQGRSTQDDVRGAVRGVAEAGERLSGAGGSSVGSAALVTALRAVIGDAGSFASLRAGTLVEIPAGGGLDLLVPVALSPSRPRAVPPPARNADPDEAAAASRVELERSEALLARARERAALAQRGVLRAQASMDAAEERLQQAEKQLSERRAELERARDEAAATAAEVTAAEGAMAELRGRR